MKNKRAIREDRKKKAQERKFWMDYNQGKVRTSKEVL